MGSGERWIRGALSPLDLVPGVAGVTKFSTAVRTAYLGKEISQFELKTGVKTNIQRGVSHVDDMVITAGRQTISRLKSAEAAIQDTTKVAKEKLATGATGAVTQAKNIDPSRRMVAMDQVGNVHMPAENTHFFENQIRNTLNKAEGVNIDGKGADEIADGIIRDGSHIVDKGKLKTNIKYQTGEYNYLYETDELGRIKEFNADDLRLTERENRLPHNSETAGKKTWGSRGAFSS